MWLLSAPAFATIHVGAGDSFQAAVDAAADGDVIQIDALTLTDDAPLQIDKRVTIQGAGAGTVLELPDRATVDPSVQILVDVTFRDLTIDGRDQTTLLWVKNSAHLALDGVALQNASEPGGSGGGVRLDDAASLSATDATFQGLSAKEGGAIFLVGHASLDCLRCTFHGDHAVGPQGDGGAIWLDGGTVTLTDDTFDQDASEHWYGGAISINGAPGVVHVLGGTFSSDSAVDRGGAISIRNGATLTVEPSSVSGTRFVGNVGSDGGAIACDGLARCAVSIAGASFTGNLAHGDGAAVFAQNGAVEITDTTFAGGRADSSGGGVSVTAGSLAATRAIWCDNVADDAGGAVQTSAGVTFANVVALRNTAGKPGGAFALVNGTVSFGSLIDNVNETASEIVGGPGLSLDAVVLVRGADAVVAIATVDHGATWKVQDPYTATVDVVESTRLQEDPFDLSADFCGYPIPAYGGELVDQDGDARDLDGSIADLGATGGPDADPSLWADDDGDGVVVMWDCDDADDRVGAAPDCVTAPTTPTSPSTPPAETGTPIAGWRGPGLEDGSAVGCGCDTPPLGAPWAVLVGLALAAQRRRAR